MNTWLWVCFGLSCRSYLAEAKRRRGRARRSRFGLWSPRLLCKHSGYLRYGHLQRSSMSGRRHSRRPRGVRRRIASGQRGEDDHSRLGFTHQQVCGDSTLWESAAHGGEWGWHFSQRKIRVAFASNCLWQEKNPNAVITLKHRRRLEGSRLCSTCLVCWRVPYAMGITSMRVAFSVSIWH